MSTRTSWFIAGALALAAAIAGPRTHALAQRAEEDPAVKRIIELGTRDNQVMTWNDYASNRFGGRETGTNAYTDATQWARWQLTRFGLQVALEPAGELPVGFNRGPWFGKMLAPAEKPLRFATPSFTAGTKGVQRGRVVVLKADPFSIPGRATNGQPVAAEHVAKKRAAVAAAIDEIAAAPDVFKGAWVLIGGNRAEAGVGRDGRRGTKLPDGSPEYVDAELIPPLTKALVAAGAIGTIQASTPPAALQAANNSEPPISALDGYVASWDTLPVLPDIKLLDTQYDEIRALVDRKAPVVLEFDIRNWFKMGPITYHNVVATLRGTTYPDEYVVIGGHFDCYSAATGAVDDGSGFGTGMEAIRLIAAAGAKPKRSILFIAFAAEELGLVGSQAWLKRHPELHGQIVLMESWDTTPYAITGATVPETWYADFQAITAPLAGLGATWPFTLVPGVPRARATSPRGSDDSAFEMQGIPTLRFAATSARTGPDGKTIPYYTYPYAWHTTNDLYSELVPYTAHQQHSAMVTAVVAYGVANLDKPLTRAGVYLPDGLYATIAVGPGDRAQQIMTTLDYQHAPLATANFIRIAEGKTPQPGGGRGGPPPGMGFGDGRRPEPPPVGRVASVQGALAAGIVESETQRTVAIPKLPRMPNAALTHDTAGILGASGPNTFYLTLRGNRGLDRKYTAIGKVIAGLGHLQSLKAGDPIRSIRITRVGQAAREFRTDDEAFGTLMSAATKK